MINKPWYVYVVRCSRGALYTGIAVDVKKRIRIHNYGKGSKAVRALGLPVSLVLKSRPMTQSEALRLEASFKKLSKTKKEQFVQNIGLKKEFQLRHTRILNRKYRQAIESICKEEDRKVLQEMQKCQLNAQ